MLSTELSKFLVAAKIIKEVHEFVIFACYVVCSELLVGYVVSSTN
jgi:hypothetical protein